ncbi:MAG: hypothetical protein JO021_07530 [Alphaproteobacteria bacterium]|nr:hypothetical protein [Alphaproteobacteria bacterium]
MSALSDALAQLTNFLATDGPVPETRGIKIFEVNTRPSDASGRILVPGVELLPPEEFEPRFRDRLAQNLPWINVSCFGVHQNELIVGVEWPNYRSTQRAVRTSINYSGPPDIVLEHGWDVRAVLSIE